MRYKNPKYLLEYQDYNLHLLLKIYPLWMGNILEPWTEINIFGGSTHSPGGARSIPCKMLKFLVTVGWVSTNFMCEIHVSPNIVMEFCHWDPVPSLALWRCAPGPGQMYPAATLPSAALRNFKSNLAHLGFSRPTFDWAVYQLRKVGLPYITAWMTVV